MAAGAVSAPEPEAVPPKEFALARIVGVLFSPVRTFESIARRPTWLAPLILWTAVSATVTVLMVPRIEFESMMRETLEERNVPAERMDDLVASQSKVAQMFTYVVGLLGPLLISILLGAVFLGAFKAFGWDMSFRQSLGVTTHAFVPAALGSLLAVPVILQRERLDPRGLGDLVRSNLGFLVSRTEAPAVYALLSSLDIFSFWALALLVIGFAAAAGISGGKAAGLVVSLWLLYVLGKAGWAAAFS